MGTKLYCKCCGKEIKLCPHCPTEYGFTPWRTLADSIDHYKLFELARMYANKEITKEQAKKHLDRIDITGYENFNTNTGKIIREIMQPDSNIPSESFDGRVLDNHDAQEVREIENDLPHKKNRKRKMISDS